MRVLLRAGNGAASAPRRLALHVPVVLAAVGEGVPGGAAVGGVIVSAAIQFEHDRYLQVVAMNAREARRFAGRIDKPIYLGHADPTRYKFGARVYGFRGVPGCRCKGCSAP